MPLTKTKAVTPVKKAAPKKASAAKKTAPVKKAAPRKIAPVVERNPREFDEHGFVIGSDSSRIVAMLLEGGDGRGELTERISSEIDLTTRNGQTKNVSSLISGLLARLGEKGYTVEQSWRLVAPDPEVAAKAARKAAREAKAAGTTPAKKSGAAGRTAPAKKAAAKRGKA